jgi:hypothetical protein
MQLMSAKFAASACLFALLAAPAVVLANKPNNRYDKHPRRVAEPSTLVMTAVGLGLGIGLVAMGLRRNRSTSAA